MAKAKPVEVITARPIITHYYRDDRLIRMNAAKWVNRAVCNCVQHLQVNDYGATSAEVFDSRVGIVHAVLTHNVVGEVNIILQRPAHKDESRYAK